MSDIDPMVEQPALFLAGEQDGVIGGQTQQQLENMMLPRVPDLRGVHLFPNTGHWTQQERAEEVNGLLVEFLQNLP